MVTKLRLALVLASCLALQACGTLYVAQAAKGQLQLLSARKPIDRVLASPKTPAELKARLEADVKKWSAVIERAKIPRL